MSSLETQVEQVYKDYPSTTQLQKTANDRLLKVDHDLVISSATQYGLTLFIRVPNQYPKAPPEATLPYCCHRVSMLPPHADRTTGSWDSSMTLVEGVRNAFQNAADLWGPVTPPTMANVTVHLSTETDKLLKDLVSNPNCLDAYCYQLPVVKQMRDTSKETLMEIKRLAEENMSLRTTVEKLNGSVRSQQAELQKQMDYLQKVGGNPLIKSVCTTRDLLSTLEQDVKVLNKECDTIGRDCLSAYSNDRREFQNKLAEFKTKSKMAHIIDLKRRSYKQQTQS